MELGLITTLAIAVICTGSLIGAAETSDNGLLVFTVATEPTDGFKRFMRSAKKYGLNVQVLGMGEEWRGGDVVKTTGGGQKVLLLREAVEAYKDRKDKLIMFVDSYDLVFSAGEEDIKKTFEKFKSRVVFSAEDFCWPDQNLANQYPLVKINEKRYLNSGGFIGYAPEMFAIMTSADIKNGDDDQLFYIKVFLNETLREKYAIKLDTKNEIFQNLNGALEEVKIKFKGSSSYLYNARTGNIPLVVHGNGPIKPQFNNLANYLADQWTPVAGCLFCKEDTISLKDVKVEDYPRVLIGLFIEKPTPFVDFFLKNVANLAYPKEKIDIFLHNSQKIHKPEVHEFIRSDEAANYNSIKLIKPEQQMKEEAARNAALEECLKLDCQYYLAVDSEVQVENRDTLVHLIQTNRSVVNPVMTRPNKMWSTFWGALSKDGFYKRADDYAQIVQNERRGLWNVPHISNIYLMHGRRVAELQGAYTATEGIDPDMAFCNKLRDKNIFLYADNQAYYGLLTNPDNYPSIYLHNDLWAVFTNKQMWEKKYIDADYWKELEPKVENRQPCNDVFWLPFATEKWADDMVEEAEHYGKWSGGGHKDDRLAGGYENVPTVDIHMSQIGLEQTWLRMLRDYVAPVANKVYEGYFSEARANMNFMVRYKPGEQDYLRPHHDTSTYSLNIALNHPKIDFVGGGTRFIRQNCSIHSKKGWLIVHPGRLTHWHEGLPTTNGTRYIMVCFVDP